MLDREKMRKEFILFEWEEDYIELKEFFDKIGEKFNNFETLIKLKYKFIYSNGYLWNNTTKYLNEDYLSVKDFIKKYSEEINEKSNVIHEDKIVDYFEIVSDELGYISGFPSFGRNEPNTKYIVAFIED